MKQIDVDELKQIQLEILQFVDCFCRQNDINYFLDGGTLLGAIRHNGYIPWDDDIDIGLLRSDYDKLLSLFNVKNKETKYKLISGSISKEYPYAFSKIIDKSTLLYEPDKKGLKLNVHIDVFVYDNIPVDTKLRNKIFRTRDICTLLSQLQYGAIYPDNIVKKIITSSAKLVLTVFPKGFFTNLLLKNMRKCKGIRSPLVADLSGAVDFVCDRDAFSSYTEKNFEGSNYKIPIGYDKLLRCIYGDYMVLPPKEKQISHHKFIAYIR